MNSLVPDMMMYLSQFLVPRDIIMMSWTCKEHKEIFKKLVYPSFKKSLLRVIGYDVGHIEGGFIPGSVIMQALFGERWTGVYDCNFVSQFRAYTF